MEKTENEESRSGRAVRERPSPAESGFQGSASKVHSGVDLVKVRAGYGRARLAGYVRRTLRA